MWIKRALHRAAKRLAPDLIPLSGERTRGQDYYSVTIRLGDERMLLDDLTSAGAQARAWTGNAYDRPVELSWRDLKSATYSFSHYVKGWHIERTSPAKFVLAELVRLHYLYIFRERVAQGAFNARKLAVTDQRIDVLRKVIALTQEATDRRITQLGYITSIYGVRVLAHPAHAQIRSHYEMLFESLVESGDLQKIDGVYLRVKPTALITLSNYEQEERRHRDIVRPQKWVAILTVALVLAAVGQVVVAYLQYRASPSVQSAPGAK